MQSARSTLGLVNRVDRVDRVDRAGNTLAAENRCVRFITNAIDADGGAIAGSLRRTHYERLAAEAKAGGHRMP